ncbi:unnamed protein product [Nezara viridula]|uniref:Uncharacterized protein n=1 Tax=Nezara viridula TaxID=85310 RepID=A0A9P0E4T3_NEZVI|nr:unnamed protein product [Nezara viridula]
MAGIYLGCATGPTGQLADTSCQEGGDMLAGELNAQLWGAETGGKDWPPIQGQVTTCQSLAILSRPMGNENSRLEIIDLAL